MRIAFKKPLVTLLICLMVLPTWLGIEMVGATRAKAEFSPQVFINEVMPDPVSGNDWVELYNPNNTAVSLSGWVLKDAGTNKKTFTSELVPAYKYLLVPFSNYLNKSGDSVGLFDSGDNPIDSFMYTDATAGVSWGRSYDGGVPVVQFLTPSPNAQNLVSIISPDHAAGSFVKNQEKTITGMISPNADYDGIRGALTADVGVRFSDIFQTLEVKVGSSPYVNMLNDTHTSVFPTSEEFNLKAGVIQTVSIHFVVKDTSIADSFEFYAFFIDKEWNELSNEVVLDMTIEDTDKPVVTLVGDAEMNVELGSIFDDPGATVTDNLDTGLTAIAPETVDTNTLGDYTLTYSATDAAGNVSIPVSRTVHVVERAVPAVSFSATATGKTVTIVWDKVVGAAEYHVYIKSKVNGAITASDPFATVGPDVTRYQNSVAEYGQYYVLVIVKNAFGEFGLIPAPADQSIVDVIAPVVAAAPIVEAPAPTPAPAVSVGPSKAQAATPTVTTPSDDSGKIKGDETATTDEDGKVNWTPWIVLFILIVLAGAATGGYFYWFGNDDDNKKEDPKAAKAAPKKVVPPVKEEVKTTIRNKKKPDKKAKRW